MLINKKYYSQAQDIVADLVRIGVIQINFQQLFTWSSGLKSPLYLDNRIIPAFVLTRQRIYNALAWLIKETFPQAQMILGIQTGGIIPATFIGHFLILPVGYVRNKTKHYGLGKSIEGKIAPGMNVVLVEDTVSTGSTLLKAYRCARQMKLRVLGAVCIFNYCLKKTEKLFKQHQLSVHHLVTFQDLIQFLTTQDQKLGIKMHHFFLTMNQKDDVVSDQ